MDGCLPTQSTATSSWIWESRVAKVMNSLNFFIQVCAMTHNCDCVHIRKIIKTLTANCSRCMQTDMENTNSEQSTATQQHHNTTTKCWSKRWCTTGAYTTGCDFLKPRPSDSSHCCCLAIAPPAVEVPWPVLCPRVLTPTDNMCMLGMLKLV